MSNKMMSISKPIISVTDMAKSVGLSRARFYQLIKEGIFPQPIYSVRTRRPFYDKDLQEECIQIRQTGIGHNSEYILFYSPRENNPGKRKSLKKKSNGNPLHTEIVDTLQTMGLTASESQVDQVVKELYPDGMGNLEIGVVVRDVYRHIKNGGV